MICERGLPYLYSPEGAVLACIDSGVALDWALVADRVDYFSHRVGEWVPVGTVTVGIVVLLLAVIAVGSLLK